MESRRLMSRIPWLTMSCSGMPLLCTSRKKLFSPEGVQIEPGGLVRLFRFASFKKHGDLPVEARGGAAINPLLCSLRIFRSMRGL